MVDHIYVQFHNICIAKIYVKFTLVIKGLEKLAINLYVVVLLLNISHLFT